MKKVVLIGGIVVIAVLAYVLWPSSSGSTPEAQNRDVASDVTTREETEQKPLPERGVYRVNTGASTFEWVGRKEFIASYEDRGLISASGGQFKVASGTLESGRLVFDMSSIRTTETGKGNGQSRLTSHLKSADFFAVDEYPQATFVLRNATATDEFTHTLTGDLTIRGETHEITFPAEVYLADDALQLDGEIDIDRTRWNVRYGSDKFFDNLGDAVIADTFTLNVELVGTPVFDSVNGGEEE